MVKKGKERTLTRYVIADVTEQGPSVRKLRGVFKHAPDIGEDVFVYAPHDGRPGKMWAEHDEVFTTPAKAVEAYRYDLHCNVSDLLEEIAGKRAMLRWLKKPPTVKA
jgi:hypothetical protein